VAVLDDSLDGALGRKTADALAKALDLHTVAICCATIRAATPNAAS